MSQIRTNHSHYINISSFTTSSSSAYESKRKVRELTKPVRIAELLGQNHHEKNSTVKISMPERLTPYLKSSSKKQNETNMYTKLFRDEKNVRRNLNFSTAKAQNPSTKPKIDTSTKKLSKEKEKLCSFRESFLVPPNTIKNMHVKCILEQKKLPHSNMKINSENKYQKIVKESENCLPLQNLNTHNNSTCEKNKKTLVTRYTSSQINLHDQSGINILQSPNTDLTNASNDSIKKEIADDIKPDKNLDINVPSNKESQEVASNILDLSSSTCIMNTPKIYSNSNAGENTCVLHHADEYPLITSMLPDTEKIYNMAHSSNIEEGKPLSTNICENLHSSLQVITAINESCVNSQFNANDSEYVTLKKTELVDLASKLKLLICRREEEISILKLTLTTITNALSTVNVTNKITEINETKVRQQTTEHLNDNAEATNSTDTQSSLCATKNNTCTQNDNILKKACKTQHIDLLKLPEAGMFKESNTETSHQIDSKSDKENKEMLDSTNSISKSKTRRRSARLMAKALNNLNVTNDSFVNLENELMNNEKSDNIQDATIATPRNSPITNTPITNKYKNKKGGRPLKEYMALKSRMSCLLTPNIKQFNSMGSVSVAPESDGAKASLSSKILVELNNLYADSPDTQ